MNSEIFQVWCDFRDFKKQKNNFSHFRQRVPDFTEQWFPLQLLTYDAAEVTRYTIHTKNSGSFQMFFGLYTPCVQISAQSQINCQYANLGTVCLQPRQFPHVQTICKYVICSVSYTKPYRCGSFQKIKFAFKATVIFYCTKLFLFVVIPTTITSYYISLNNSLKYITAIFYLD